MITNELGSFLRDPVGIRTQDPQLRRLLLYPAELPDHFFRFISELCYNKKISQLVPDICLVGLPGFEPGQAEPKSVVLPLHHKPINPFFRSLAKKSVQS